MNKTRILSVAVLLAGALAQATTNFYATFEGSALGVVTADSIMNDGTVLGGTWVSANWANTHQSSIIANAGLTDQAFEFGVVINAGTADDHKVDVHLDSAASFASLPVAVSFDAAVPAWDTGTGKIKALFIDFYDSADTIIFSAKIPYAASTSVAYLALQYRADALDNGGIALTSKNALTLATIGTWAVSNNIEFHFNADGVDAYLDGIPLASGLSFITNAPVSQLTDIKRISINSSQGGIQIDDFLIETLALTTLGTPFAWLQSYGYTDDFNAADLEDIEPDGLLNWEEYLAGTDPTLASTDGDQFSDSVELNAGADPLADDSVVYAAIMGSSYAFGFYSSNNVMDVTYGDAALSTSNDVLLIDLQMLGSEDLEGIGWSALSGAAEFQSTTTNSTQAFYRFETTQ